MSFQLTGRKRYGNAASLEEAKAAFKADYVAWLTQMTSDERRRLLGLLATADDGCTAELLLALGFTPDLVLGVVRAGLATAQTENVLAGGRAVVVSRVRITEVGRLAAGR